MTTWLHRVANVAPRWRSTPVTLHVIVISAATTAAWGLGGLGVAKFMGAGDRGVVAALQTLSSMQVLVLSLGLVYGARVLLADPARRVDVTSYVRSTRPLALAAVVVSVLASAVVLPHLTKTTGWLIAAIFVVQASALYRATLLREALQGLGWHRATLIVESAGAWFITLGTAAAWLIGRLTLDVALVIAMVGTCLHFGLQWNLVRRARTRTTHYDRDPRDDRALLKQMILFSLPGLVTAAGALAARGADRMILAFVHGPDAMGVYATAASLADFAWALPAAASSMVVRAFTAGYSRQLHTLWWRRVMLATLALAVPVMLVGYWLLEHFLGPDFDGSWPILAICLGAALFMASNQVDQSVCAGRGDLGAGAKASVWGLSVGVVAYAVLIPPFAAVGCAVGSLACFASMAIASRLYVRRHVDGAPMPVVNQGEENVHGAD